MATVLAMLVETVLIGAADASGAKLPGGNPKGVALLAKVAKRYLTIPGVRVDAGTLGVILISLTSGVVKSEEWRTSGPGGDYIYLSRRNRPLYEYIPSRHCWLRNPPSARDLTSEVGQPFVTAGLEQVEAPVRVPGGWKLRATLTDTDGQVVEFQITASYLLRQVTTCPGNHKRLVERIHQLARSPHVPATRPLCRRQ